MTATRALRILMITPTIGGAGAETHLVYLAVGLARRGHTVTIACIREPYRDTGSLQADGVRVVTLNRHRARSRALAVPRLARFARRADVVYCSIWDASLWGRLAALAALRPVVVTEHTPGRQFELAGSGAARARWIAAHNRILGRMTYAVVAVGRWQIPVLRSEGVPAERIVHIPNGIPFDQVALASRQGVSRADLDLPEDALVLLHAARFHPMKSQQVTLDVASRLRKELGDVHVLFAGDGATRHGVEGLARLRGADWAHFLGERRDVPALMRLADVVVLPSLGEGMPITVLEALAVGVPIVATDVGDVGRVLRQVGGGLAVPADDMAAFHQACRSVLADPRLRSTLFDSSAAKRAFDIDEMVDRYVEVFNAAASRRPLAKTAPGSAQTR
jgi:glycosyltransferase involved in cell wall biosynthesis